MSEVPSLDDLVAAVCPPDKPHKCLPHGVCYGKYHYCSSASKTVEPCISENILQNPDSLKQLCQGIANGQNITELTRDPACNLKTDCFEEFETQFYAAATKEVPSLDDLVAAVCPPDKPHKCLPHGVCYGKYHYCSSASKTVEPCISENILQNPDSLKQLCQGIANGQNITELTRDPACNLKTDCFEEFETQFYAAATKEVSVPSLDDLVAVVCPTDKPLKCFPHGFCYGKYHYCSSASKTAEPCISETILQNPDSLKQLCQDIANGENITELIRHPACDLKADCFKDFETLFRYTSKEVSVPSLDDLVAVVCPTDKPLRCFPHGFCYGKYHYCSSAFKTAEPCISETILQNPDSLKQLCQDIANGENITELIRHPACDLKADCFKDFETLFRYTSKEESGFPWWWIVLGILVLFVAALFFTFLYFKEKAKRSKYEMERHRVVSNNNDREAFNVQANHRIDSLFENGNQSQESADPEPNDTGTNTELQPLVGCGDDAGNARNPPDSGRAPYPASIHIHIDAPSGSDNNRNSHHASASFGSEPPEEDQSSTFPKIIRCEDHPAEVESRMQRGVHMSSSEPSGTAQLVTNPTKYDRTNNGDLD